MEEKKLSVFQKISIIYFVCAGLYAAGFILCAITGLAEYRMAVGVLGNCAVCLGFPVWLFVFCFRLLLRKKAGRLARCLSIVIFAGVFLLWTHIFFLITLLSLQDEHRLFGDYLAVNRNTGFLEETRYELCKSKALFFRVKTEWDTDFEIEYLEREYRQTFQAVPFQKDKMFSYEAEVYGRDYRNGEPVAVSAVHRNLPIKVVLAGGYPEDDYIEVLTAWYITEGCRELNIDRSMYTDQRGNMYLYLSGEEDIRAAAEDVQKLIDYAMQDEMFQNYRGTIRLSTEFGSFDTIFIPFGKTGEPQPDTEALEKLIREKYERILEDRRQFEVYEAKQKKEQEGFAESGLTGGEGIANGETEQDGQAVSEESEYAKEARRIYEEVLIPQELGESFTVEYNAKGEEYYPLSGDDVYHYTLIYDRDSGNGACRLYVLYRSPYDEESGSFYSYTDSLTQIADIYAVVKETGEIIPSGRTAWSDVGNSEYREAVGE